MINKGLLSNWGKSQDGYAKLLNNTSGYKHNQIDPYAIQSSQQFPVYTPPAVNNTVADNTISNNEGAVASQPYTAPDTTSTENSGILGDLQAQNLVGSGGLASDISNTVGIDPNGWLGAGVNTLVNKGIGAVSPGGILGPLGVFQSVINGKTVDTPWGDKFNVGAPSTISGKIGQYNLDALKDIYGQAQAGNKGYDFYVDPATNQPFGFKPGPFGYGQVAQGNLPEGVTNKAEADAFFTEQADNAAAKAQYIQDNGITENPDGSYTYENGYTTNVTDSKGIPSTPSDAYLEQVAEKEAAAKAATQTWNYKGQSYPKEEAWALYEADKAKYDAYVMEKEAAAQAKAEQDAKDAHAAQVAANLAAQQAAAEKAAQDAADAAAAEAAAQAAKQAAYQAQVDAQNNDDNHGGQTDGSQTGSETSHGGGYGGYADDTASSNDGGGSSGGK